MLWDGLLFAVFFYSVLRGAERGGRELGVELFSVAITYAATFTLGPVLAALVRRFTDDPPLLLPVGCALAVFLGVRRLARAGLRRLREGRPGEPRPGEVAVSALSGAGLGALRGAAIAVALGIIGCSFLGLQKAGMLQGAPSAQASVMVGQVQGVLDWVAQRYTRGAGPTTRELVRLTLSPEPDRVDAFLRGPFVARVVHSEAMAALVRDRELRDLVADRRAAAVLTHPTFLRLVSFAVDELRNEPPASAAI